MSETASDEDFGIDPRLTAPASDIKAALAVEFVNQIQLRAQAIRRHLQFHDVREVTFVLVRRPFASAPDHCSPTTVVD
jgi:hypothetical protein